ncbi:hypothetical protein EDD18DRAFT_1232685 [Armillaria luteobubalina]|uniref:Uncharacterized protein n=1 Tax=Armillaria luteobubalina TaxID=153913 RepID=A0AA39NUR1_9AGAR|nr:hypothetical protein EDD18DRAFT_1232685 [Armillaria luteobubalina]
MAVIVSLYILMNSQAGNFAVDALRRAKLRDRGDIVCVRSYIALTICIDVPQTRCGDSYFYILLLTFLAQIFEVAALRRAQPADEGPQSLVLL